MNCKSCEEQMQKTGTLDSGNSTFQVWKCERCGIETMQALGVNGES